MMKHFFLAILIVLICGRATQAQKVGLVLSGGGAKGLAHIAVIRALEENGIPIDYISGTSMGAIVAGLYAAGYSPDEMEKLFKSEQFKFWSTGEIQEEYRYFFNKGEEDPSWLELDLQKKAEKLKIVPPTNLIPEEQMDFAFMEMFSSVTGICKSDFNKLFVPFFCIATDVYHNKEMLLRNGDLGEAIRASMTFPLYFKPIEINGSLVFDGGIVNNFPVQDMKSLFNPDIIIGHSVASNPEKPDPDNVMAQIENMIMQKTDYTINPEDGVFMQTTFDDVGLLDFKKIDQIESSGYQTVYKSMEEIKKRISKRVRPSEIQQRRSQFNMKKPAMIFHNVQVEGVTDNKQREYILHSIKHKSNIFDLKALKSAYFKLVTDPQIKSLRPVALYNPETGYFDLNLIVKQNNPMKIKFGANVSTRPINQGFISGDYRIFNKRSYTLSSNMYFGRFYSSLKVGARIDYPTTLPFYLAGYFTLNRWDYYSSTTEFVFEDVRPPYIIQNENNFRAELGFPINTWGKITFGESLSNASDKYYLNQSIKATDTADRTTFDALTSSANIISNSFNDKQYPTEGSASSLSFNYISGKEQNFPGSTASNTSTQSFNHNFIMLKGAYDRYFKLNSHFALGLMAEGVYSNQKPFNNYVSTVLAAPCFNPLPHSKTIYMSGFHANKYVASGIKGIVKFSDSFHLRAEAYAFVPGREIIETANHLAEYSEKQFSGIKFMGTGALVFQSAIGPVSLSVNYYDKSQTRFFAMLNVGYIIFNKRGY
ncbi:MAG TPA: patatin-like phospholipase family protein [Prolixibacteraceae bacterium]|nr:patatin-like phospholipase family protein [Prolixibacteraceae bacterium]HPR85109.1 patatin-like phospholipase family protein [Prolixibacteraceae bacterium]